MKQLYFVRHGQTEWNAIARMQGQWNSDLNEIGREQAETNGYLLASLGIERIFSSPLDRTRQTTEIINQHMSIPVDFDDRIMEWDCGDWSGHLYAEIADKWPVDWAALQDDRFHTRAPNGENYPDMFDRARPFLRDIHECEEQHIAIVSHGMIGKVMVSELLNLGEQETLAIHQSNDVIFRVTLGDSQAEVAHFIFGKGPYPGLPPRE